MTASKPNILIVMVDQLNGTFFPDGPADWLHAPHMKALAARSSGTLELWGDGSQLRSYLHVDDAVDRIITIATAGRYDGPVNVGAAGPVTCREIAELCLDIVGADADIVTNPAEPTGVLARDCSNARYDDLYGPGPQRSYRAGFESFISWLDRL